METFYWVLAIGGSSLFLLKMVLLFVGGAAGDLDAETDVGGHSDQSAAAFKLLTLQSLSAFSMGTGWAGIAAMNTLHWDEGRSLLAAVLVGFGFVALLGFLMSQILGLQSSGTMNPGRAIGKIGSVYAGIPAGGRGQIQVEFQGRLATLDAVAHGQPIPRGTRVRVESVASDGTLVVAPHQE